MTRPILPAADNALAESIRGTTGPALRSPAGAGPNPKQPCLSCDGAGEAEWLALDETSPRWLICDDCDGTGYAKKPYCPTCDGQLTVDGWCHDCDDWGSLVYVERISPTRIAL